MGEVAVVGMDLATTPAIADHREGSTSVIEKRSFAISVDDVSWSVLGRLESREGWSARIVAKDDFEIRSIGGGRHEEREIRRDIGHGQRSLATNQNVEAVKIEADRTLVGDVRRFLE